MPNSLNKPKTVAILGAGPVGLAAAAHVLERGMQPVVLEAGPQVGHAVRQWSHVPLFSPWEYAIDKASERLLTAAGWNSPAPDQYPTGGELLAQYLEPLATRTPLKDHIRTSSLVTSVGRAGFDKMKNNGRAFEPFTIRYQNGKGPEQLKADAVIDATGTWFSPNPAGADGLPAIGEREMQDRIAYGMPDVLGRERAPLCRPDRGRAGVRPFGHRHADRSRAAQGRSTGNRGHLAAARRQAREGVRRRRQRQARRARRAGRGLRQAGDGRQDLRRDRLPRLAHRPRWREAAHRRRLLAAAATSRSTSWWWRRASAPTSTSCARSGCRSIPPSSARPTLAPLIDPNIHSCGTVRPHGARELAQPEPGFYFAGMKSYGRAPTFLMLTGYEQVRSIVAEIAGDHEAAARVELVLPETGVCSGPGPEAELAKADAAGCCGGPAPEPASGCCVADVKAKQEGKAGCGC